MGQIDNFLYLHLKTSFETVHNLSTKCLCKFKSNHIPKTHSSTAAFIPPNIIHLSAHIRTGSCMFNVNGSETGKVGLSHCLAGSIKTPGGLFPLLHLLKAGFKLMSSHDP